MFASLILLRRCHLRETCTWDGEFDRRHLRIGRSSAPAGAKHTALGQAPTTKIIRFYRNSNYRISNSFHPTKGRFASRHEAWCGMRWTLIASGARCEMRGGRRVEPNPVSISRAARGRTALDAYGKGVWTWLSLLQSSFAEAVSSQPVRCRCQFAKRR